jgi:putative ABC transport system permease protein
MLKSYFLTALRSLKRNKLHASINIIGLAIGMTCCILITLFVQFELTYDSHNKQANRIHRVVVDLEANNWAISAFPLGALLKDNFPEVENYTRIKPVDIFLQDATTMTKHKEKMFYADSTVFDVLDITLTKGDAATALSSINTMVMTEARARAYFGNEDPIGKTLIRPDNKREFVITGIFEPLPSNSHLHPEILASSDSFNPMRADFEGGWNSLTNHYTYLVLPEDIDHVAFGKTISAFLDKFHELTPDQPRNVLKLQPLTSIHLHSDRGLEIEANGNVNTVYILSAIAFFILIIACINFMNLTTAQSLKRAREVGVRKVVGSKKSQLIFQFLSESVLISAIALAISALLLALVVPQFNLITGKDIILNPLKNGMVTLVVLAITLFVGLCAGLYPAFILSAFKPSTVLKGNFIGNVGGQRLRKALVVFQFAIAFVIMVGTYVVYQQLHYMRNKNIGFDREQTLVVNLPGDSLTRETLKTEIKRLAGVEQVTRFVEVPGKMVRTTSIWYEGVKDNRPANMYIFSGDTDLAETLGMTMKRGHYFQEGNQRLYSEYVINETAVKHFGWKLDEAVGKLINLGDRGDNPGKVVGVIEDFHFKHLHDVIDPLVMYQEAPNAYRYMAVKMKAGNLSATVANVEKTWKAVAPGHEFEYQFLDESFDKLFDQEKRLGLLFTIFSGLAIFVSCLGLFGLASFTMEQGRKAIAIRKVLGASVPTIMLGMSRDFLKLVVLGMIVACPISYFIMNKWLEGFAYNAGFSWFVFVYAGAVGVLVAFGTVSYHSLKAATANPVTSLKDQ